MGYLFLALAFLLNAAANILLKVGALKLTGGGLDIRALVQNWQLLLGLALFAGNVIFYALALRALPLSVAYPVMVGMTFLIVSTASIVVLHEQIAPVQYAGFVFILLGLALAVAR